MKHKDSVDSDIISNLFAVVTGGLLSLSIATNHFFYIFLIAWSYVSFLADFIGWED
jgi:hypothetical protein